MFDAAFDLFFSRPGGEGKAGSIPGRSRPLALDPKQALAWMNALGLSTPGVAREIEGPPASRQPLLRALDSGLHGIVFSSGSAVRGLLALLAPAEQARARAIPALCIGPVTAEQAASGGFEVALVAADHSGTGLARAIAAHFATEVMA